jgi:hypothetical protein
MPHFRISEHYYEKRYNACIVNADYVPKYFIFNFRWLGEGLSTISWFYGAEIA